MMGWGWMKRREGVRDASVVMINLAEAKLGMVRMVDGWLERSLEGI